MNYLSKFLLIHFLRNSISEVEIGYILHEKMSGALGFNSMVWSFSHVGGKHCAAFSEKTSINSLYCSGIEVFIIISFFL
jgi:hypothetical protein